MKFIQNKDILVTGSSGFIGSHLMPKLPYAFMLDQVDTTSIEDSEVIIKDIQPDILIHLASHSTVKQVQKDPVKAADSIIVNLARLIEWHKPQQVIYFSSSMVYGNFNDDVKEDQETNPTNLYGIFKKTAEDLIKSLGVNYTIIRPSAVYGPKDKPERLIPTFFKKALKGETLEVHGDNAADFTYVDDVVNGVLKVINNEEAYNQTFNLTYGESHTIESLAQQIIKLTNSKSKINKTESENIYPKRGSLNIDKIKKLGYNPAINLEKGLKQTYELFWSRQNI